MERWNGGMEACVVLSTSLVHVGNSCIRVVAESSIMGRLNSGMTFPLSDHACVNSVHGSRN